MLECFGILLAAAIHYAQAVWNHAWSNAIATAIPISKSLVPLREKNAYPNGIGQCT